MTPEEEASAYAHCASVLRDNDYDRWLAALFAPAAARRHLYAIYAFSSEVAGVAQTVSEPNLGELRLQWWREALAGEREEAGGHPVARALRATIARCRLPTEPFRDLIDARVFDLFRDPAPNLAWLEGYCGETSSALFRLAALALADGRETGDSEAAGHAGLAWAMTGILRALPWSATRGQIFIPLDMLRRRGADPGDIMRRRATPELRATLGDLRACARLHLERARRNLSGSARACRPAYIVLALTEIYLAQMEQDDYEPFATRVDVSRWRKVYALWRRSGDW